MPQPAKITYVRQVRSCSNYRKTALLFSRPSVPREFVLPTELHKSILPEFTSSNLTYLVLRNGHRVSRQKWCHPIVSIRAVVLWVGTPTWIWGLSSDDRGSDNLRTFMKCLIPQKKRMRITNTIHASKVIKKLYHKTWSNIGQIVYIDKFTEHNHSAVSIRPLVPLENIRLLAYDLFRIRVPLFCPTKANCSNYILGQNWV